MNPGEVLLQEGETSGKLYFLIDGEVEILKGRHRISLVSESGAVFGEISALLNVPHTATVRAATACSVCLIEGASEFLENHPKLAFELSKMLAQRLHGVTNSFADLKSRIEDKNNDLKAMDEILASLSDRRAED